MTFDKKYGPHLLYFLSIDIINSTSIKNELKNKKESSSSWSIMFNSFFNDVDNHLGKIYKDIPEINDFQGLFKWRTIGDEIVYFSQIKDLYHLVEHVKAAITFSKEFNAREHNNLKIKLTSWIAGFPVNNALFYEKEQELLAHNSRKIRNYPHINFLGPCIDTGFRIAKYSSLDKFVLSIDLTLVLLHYINSNCKAIKNNQFKFYFDNEKTVKGINNGRYPIIWLNLKEKDSREFILEKKDKCCTETLYKYCIEYMEENRIFKPFVIQNQNEIFKYSEQYIKEFNKVKKVLLFNEEETPSSIEPSFQKDRQSKIDLNDLNTKVF